MPETKDSRAAFEKVVALSSLLLHLSGLTLCANLTPNLMINVWRYGPAAITQRWMEESDRAIRELCY